MTDSPQPPAFNGPLRVGVGGPVGSGKTSLVDALCRSLRDHYDIAAITNDIYTRWDAEYLVRSGADNLAATFTPELADVTIYVIDVAAGDKIPSKGGPGITRSDLLVINKVDLAPHVGASLEVMERDARRMRGQRPFVFTNLKSGDGLEAIARFVEERGGLNAS